MASKGTLVVYTFLANETIPVKNAVVTVTMSDGDNPVLLGVRLTDESGRTSPIIINTPDAELSLEPQSQIKPFTSVNVRTDHPSAYTVITRNVQIFPNEISIENVRMIPLEDDVPPDKTIEYIEITPQNL